MLRQASNGLAAETTQTTSCATRPQLSRRPDIPNSDPIWAQALVGRGFEPSWTSQLELLIKMIKTYGLNQFKHGLGPLVMAKRPNTNRQESF